MEAHGNWSFLSGASLSRRAFLKRFTAASALSLSVGLLAACGDDDDDDDDDSGGGVPTATTAGAGGDATATEEEDEEPSEDTPTEEAAEEDERRGGTLTYGFGVQALQSIDPPRVQIGIVAGTIVSSLFSALVQFDEGLNVMPDLAESWEVSDDALEYVFLLRSGLTFHNGDSLTAEDFVYTFNRTQDPELASPHANKLANITSAEAVDELTFKLTFSDPFGPFLALACSRGPGRALTPVPRRAVEELGNDEFNLKPVGCGPFMLLPETMDPGAGFEMVAFEDWYGGRPLLDKIVVRVIPEPSSRISALEAGDIDMLDIVPPQGVAQLEGVSGLEIIQVPGTNWIGLQFNVTRPPWDNYDARLAVAKAIDKQEYIDTALFGLGTIGGPIAPSFGWCYIPPHEIEGTPQAYDLEAAKELAEQAGIVGAQPVILAPADNPRGAEVIRNILGEIGVEVQIDLLTAAVYTERWEAGDYDFDIEGSVVDADPDDNVYNFFHSEGPWNTGGWANEEADRLLDFTRATANQDERAGAFRELQQLLHDEVSFVFLYTAPDVVGMHDYVKDYREIPEMRYLESVWLDR